MMLKITLLLICMNIANGFHIPFFGHKENIDLLPDDFPEGQDNTLHSGISSMVGHNKNSSTNITEDNDKTGNANKNGSTNETESLNETIDYQEVIGSIAINEPNSIICEAPLQYPSVSKLSLTVTDSWMDVNYKSLMVVMFGALFVSATVLVLVLMDIAVVSCRAPRAPNPQV